MKDRIKVISHKESDERRIRALESIVRNKGKNKRKSLLEAGYSQAYAQNNAQFLNTNKVKQELDWMKYERERIQDRMEKTRNKAKYKELGDTWATLKKIDMVTNGEPTERLVISKEEQEAVDRAFNDNTFDKDCINL